MPHASYYRCLDCGKTFATEDKPPVCPQCGGKKRQQLPSVTTILGSVGWKCEGLKYWAWKQGEQGLDLRGSMEKEASVGTLAHMAIRAELLGQEFDVKQLDFDPEQKLRVARALQAWREWRDNSKLEMVASELPLISPTMMYGGTLDGGVGTVSGKLGIIDFKTGALYSEALLQVAAYAALWTEAFPDKPIAEVHLLQLGKDTGTFTHKRIPAEALEPACKAFVHALALHQLKKPVEALL